MEDFFGDISIDMDRGLQSSASLVPDRRHNSGNVLDAFCTRLEELSRERYDEVLEDCVLEKKSTDSDKPIWAEADAASKIYILCSGAAYSFTILPNGRRYISDVFGPGAICNWSRLGVGELPCDILLKAATGYVAIRPDRLAEAFRTNPRLHNAVLRFQHARALRCSQRTRTLVVGQSTDRFMHFLLDLRDEFGRRHLEPEGSTMVETPLSQREIADLLGITPVHLSRTIQALASQERLSRDGRFFQIRDTPAEVERLEYKRFFSRRG
ncbi:Crp/Fnr family transcriptional regulator [Novosphingobium marinum]|uniref:Crp/Fnr family transcriptional regulator n=1 Tax=Novosphingobium marinum TaxID=1514948 RepID=UPI001662D6A2|nr:Crp/Fnr family transcriptional regulator [Novosphingobium marinum]